jgi:hypothetical protein
VVWLLHQTFLVASETLSGLMVYWSWAEASDSNAADARAVAVNVFIMPDYWRCVVRCALYASGDGCEGKTDITKCKRLSDC